MVPEFMKKILVAFVAVLTFGTVIPVFPAHYVDKQNNKESILKEKSPETAHQPIESAFPGIAPKTTRLSWTDTIPENASKDSLIRAFSVYTLKEAEQQGQHKFGTRVSERISPAYNREIAPLFVMAVRQLSDRHDTDWIRHLEVTHSPSSGMGERILHVYQTDSGREMLKLHVRRDHPPKNGYWFDFHYHTVQDGFQKHHELKKIYWGKNMPPKWQA